MPSCRWCGFELDGGDTCVWCKRTSTPAAVTYAVDRHKPIDNRVDFAPDPVDVSSVIPIVAGVLLFAGIVFAGAMLGRTSDAAKNQRISQITSDYKAIYSTAEQVSADDLPPLPIGDSVQEGTRLVSFERPAVGNRGPMPPLQVALVWAPVSDAEPIGLESTPITYSPELDAYVGRIALTNRSPSTLVSFRLALEVEGTSLELTPFTGKPIDPKPLATRAIRSGQTLDCPVIAPADRFPDKKPLSVLAYARFDGEPVKAEAQRTLR